MTESKTKTYTEREKKAISKFLSERAEMMNSARTLALTPERRREIAAKAGKARWAKRIKG